MSKRSSDIDNLRAIFPIAEAIAMLFRPNVEVVIHDLRTSAIAYIANSISKRKVGDPSAGEQFPGAELAENVIGPYRKVNPDGRNLRSITAVIRGAKEEPTAVMCINFDVSQLNDVAERIKAFAFLPGSLEPHAPFFHDNSRQSLERAIEAFEAASGMSIRNLDTEGRTALVRQLETSGLLNVRHAPSVVAERMGISRAALYKYLKVIRGQK